MEEKFDECDLDDLEGKKPEKKKDEVAEIFEDEDEEEEKHKKKCKPKDELDELFEQGNGSGEDVYATDDFERFDAGPSD